MQDFIITKDQEVLNFSPTEETGPRIVLEGYTPAVAELDTGLLGNKSEYLDVSDTAKFIIKGTSPTDVRTQALELRHLLDHAHRWKLNQNTAPLLLGSRPSKSTLTEIPQAVILGPPDNRQSLQLPTSFTEKNGIYSSPITMQFKRRGLWLLPEEAATPSPSTPFLDKATATWSTAHESIPAPVNVRLDFQQYVSGEFGGWFNSHAFLLFSEKPDDIIVITNFGQAGAVDESDKLASGDGYVIYLTDWTGTDTKIFSSIYTIPSPLNTTNFDVYIIAKATAGTTWLLTAKLGTIGTVKEGQTPKILYSGSGLPEPIYIGQLESNSFEEAQLIVESVVASEIDTFGLDTMILHGRTPASSAIKIFPHEDTFTDWRIDIQHNLLSKPRPEMTSRKTLVGDNRYAYETTNRRGNILIHTLGNQITATMLATGGMNPDYWQWHYRDVDTNLITRGSFTLSAWRNKPYLFPI
ncbi:MAG: hypothetical protein KC419_08160 [Anaerolineales bacterium]|nr:hypothetical protein [Anaerolineales bacterium]MCA9928435.1 hypothetical protein [Anaerolineales bacterium]